MGMHEADTRCSGEALGREEENLEQYNWQSNTGNGYAAEVRVPLGTFEPKGERVVQLRGQVTNQVPPHKTSTGLRNEKVSFKSNPYSHSTRDASNAADDYHSPSNGSVYPLKEVPLKEDPFSFAALPTQGGYILGENDLQAIFNDYFFDEYYEDMFMAECATTFMKVQQSEGWTPTEYAEVAYQYQDLSTSAPEYAPSLELVSEPELIMTIDQKGRTTPMASAIMVVRHIQGRACSRLLRVLFDSGGGKSMCHRRILPKGARLDTQEERILMQTIMGTYSPLSTAEMTGIRFPTFNKNRIVDKHKFHVFQGACKYDVILGGGLFVKNWDAPKI